jgi:hypothetical protein
MISSLTSVAKRTARVFASIVGVSSLCLAPATLAQEPIRVETNQVLVPVWVLDKDRDRLLRMDTSALWRAVTEGNAQLQEEILEGIMVRGLTAKDFQLFEDNKEQEIRAVSYERSPHYNFRDNSGHHSEYFSEGVGKWSTREWPSWLVGDIAPPHYLIAYARPESPEGSCHQVKVKVNRRNATIAARTEYCNTNHSASDPLKGTKFGQQMESDLASVKKGNVSVSLLAVALYTDDDPTRVHIAIDWPWKSLMADSKKVGVLGIVFKKDGTIITRFTDLAGPNSDQGYSGPHWDHIWTRYEMQFALPSGEYDLRVVLSDGARFGRAEIHFTVDKNDRNQLSISAVSLCKRIQDAFAYSSKSPARLPGTWTGKSPGNYVPLVSDDIEFKPTGDTRFKKDETLYTYFEVHEPLLVAEPSTTVDFRVRIVDLKTGELMSDSPPVSATPYIKPGSPVIPIGRKTNISNLPKGSYRLDVQATDSAGKTTPWRSVNFTVE